MTHDQPTTRILELFCGIGGVAAASDGRAEIVAAVDISRTALDVYAHNFPHRTVAREIETLPAYLLREWNADLWWLSPPCQPYTRRGAQRDVDDPRARSLLALIDRIAEVRPPFIALENVPEFASSRAHTKLREMLDRCGYSACERMLCPTQLGIPMRRGRFYLMAGIHDQNCRGPAGHHRLDGRAAVSGANGACSPLVDDFGRGSKCSTFENAPSRQLKDYLDDEADDDDSLRVDPDVHERYAGAIHVVDRNDPAAVAHCFTSAYGRSIVHSGSYLQTARGIRRFSPLEMARLMGQGDSFRFPPPVTTQKAWQLVGNSLSVDAVRCVLSWLLRGSTQAFPVEAHHF